VRTLNGGVAHVACVVEDDLYERGTGLRKQHVEGLADVIACALSCRSANTAEWQAVLPRRNVDDKSKERYVSRLLANPLISPLRVMQGFIPEIAEMAGSNGKTIILPMDQSKIADGFECLMLSIRTGERALPLTWEVRETSGSIGFERQKPLLDAAFAMLPEDASILLLGDRFYGTEKQRRQDSLCCKTSAWVKAEWKPISAFSTKKAIQSLGSLPCRSRRLKGGCSITACAGASSPCSPISNPEASALPKRNCGIPTASSVSFLS